MLTNYSVYSNLKEGWRQRQKRDTEGRREGGSQRVEDGEGRREGGRK